MTNYTLKRTLLVISFWVNSTLMRKQAFFDNCDVIQSYKKLLPYQ